MSKFNSAAATQSKTTNLAGGTAYKMTPELELVSALLTSFLEDKFYQTGAERQEAIIEAFNKVDPIFAAKAAIYARNEFGMRSVTHVVAGEIGGTVKGEQWTKNFFDKIVRRPDDMTEIVSYYRSKYGKSEPNAMKKGFAAAFGRFDAYQLAKYRGSTKSVKLVDIANFAHPKHTEAIKALVEDTLRNQNTFEAKLSEAGKSDNPEAKQTAWADMVTSGKLGYMALLKNLRNIIEQAPEVTGEAIKQLVDAKQIRQSLVLPFRFLTAADEIAKIPGKEAKMMIMGLGQALDASAMNVPKFEGETLVAIDTSGSMEGEPLKRAGLFGAMLVKSNMADVMLWDTSSEYLSLNPSDSLPTIAQQIVAKGSNRMGGTDVTVPFREASRAYTRIIILTDEQSWGHGSQWYGGYNGFQRQVLNSASTGPAALEQYRTRTGAKPMVYNWDLQGYGSLQFPENQVATLAGWSDKLFDIMKLVETDKHALVNTIKAVEL